MLVSVRRWMNKCEALMFPTACWVTGGVWGEGSQRRVATLEENKLREKTKSKNIAHRPWDQARKAAELSGPDGEKTDSQAMFGR